MENENNTFDNSSDSYDQYNELDPSFNWFYDSAQPIGTFESTRFYQEKLFKEQELDEVY